MIQAETKVAFQESFHLYKRLLRYVWPYWHRLGWAVLAMAVTSAATAGLAYLLKPLIDKIFVSKDSTLLVLAPVAVLVLYFFKGGAGYAKTYLVRWVGQRAMLDLRNRMFGLLVAFPAGYFVTHSAGHLISQITYDVDQVQNTLTEGIMVLVGDTLTLLALVGVLFYHDWRLALLSLVGLPVLIAPLAELTKKLRQTSRRSQQARANLTSVIEEGVVGNRVIKAFNGEPQQRARFHDEAEVHRRQNMRRTQASALSTWLVEMVGAIAVALLIWVGGYWVITPGGLTTGGFFSFLAALSMLYGPLKRIIKINQIVQTGLAAAERIFRLLDTDPEPDPGERRLERVDGHIAFEGVSFGYDPDQPVLQDVALDVPAGSVTALVGPSGGGKSTLVSLVPRFHNPQAGRITLDGIDIQEVALASLRGQIAYVSQEVVLFDDTVAANIAYGHPEASRAAVEAAAEAAGATEFIQRLEDGFDQRLGDRGTRLSGGQRQRIAIARALLRDAPILILDEATSSLDPHSEKYVQQGLERLMQDRTTLVIAHRLATIQRADQIAVMEGGRIVECGPHEELLARGGAYAYLWETQFATGEEVEAPA